MAQSSSEPAPHTKKWVWDPDYLVSLREMWIILAFFAVMLTWTIGASYWLGYPADRAAPVEVWWGVPKWFLIGVAAPWALASLISIWFAMFLMKDHESTEETAIGSKPAEEVK